MTMRAGMLANSCNTHLLHF